jgi:hypothetical protein
MLETHFLSDLVSFAPMHLCVSRLGDKVESLDSLCPSLIDTDTETGANLVFPSPV